jgi:long-chain acyl-CoA synthetase
MGSTSNAIDTQAMTSLPGMFFAQAARLGDRPFLWAKIDGVYRPRTWASVRAQVVAVAHGLKAVGTQPGDRIMLVAENRPEWFIADMAIMSVGAIAVPAYTTNTTLNHLHILNDSGSTLAIVSTPELAKRLTSAASEASHKVTVYVMDEPEKTFLSGVTTLPWYGLVAAGAGQTEPPADSDALKRDDVCALIYTSGTGGLPRGVMLTHGNILCNCMGATGVIETLGIGDEVFLSFLPLSHAYEHCAGQFFPVSLGAQIYYAERVETLTINLTEARPTVMTAVPRLYESMRQRILSGLKSQSKLKQNLFELALRLGRKQYEMPEAMTLWDKAQDKVCDLLVRKKVRQRFGGRLKAMVSGGAPLNYDVGLFFIALGVPLFQGYGQTEAAPVISANLPKRIKLKTVGPPLKGVEVKIAEDGEILVRGELVMKGYWNDSDATLLAIDKEGWLHTGDVGQVDDDNYIEITDRKKDIIVNSGGDNISPQRIQGVLCLEESIGQAMAYGDKKPNISALIVPDPDFAASWGSTHGVSGDLKNLSANAEFRAVIAKAVEHANSQLSTLEKVRRFIVAPQQFTVDNGQMTPTLKVRRHAVVEEYGAELDGLYR